MQKKGRFQSGKRFGKKYNAMGLANHVPSATGFECQKKCAYNVRVAMCHNMLEIYIQKNMKLHGWKSLETLGLWLIILINIPARRCYKTSKASF